MKAKLLLVIMSVFMILILSSCENYISTHQFNDTPTKVVSISRLDNVEFKGMCLYRIDTGVNFFYYRDSYDVVDSIGKFKIGDEVNFNLVLSK